MAARGPSGPWVPDNKGPEPEGATVGVIGGRTYGFVGRSSRAAW